MQFDPGKQRRHRRNPRHRPPLAEPNAIILQARRKGISHCKFSCIGHEIGKSCQRQALSLRKEVSPFRKPIPVACSAREPCGNIALWLPSWPRRFGDLFIFIGRRQIDSALRRVRNNGHQPSAHSASASFA
jgi:hypothetical protein